MATFHIENFGCRATAADAAAIERQFLERGYARAAADGADVVVLNTCTVTASADSQARQAIRHAHRVNPSAQIVVTGCYAQRAPEDLAQIQGVSCVVGNSHLTQIAQVAQALRPVRQPLLQIAADDGMLLARGPAKILTGNIFEQTEVLVAPVHGGEQDHTRPTLKIQDGCNNRCAYCVIPFVRGRSRSLPPEKVLAEITRLAGGGAKEIVLSGINLGSYGRDLTPRVEFGDLLRRILDQTPLEWLRVSSIEPMDVTQDLVELFASSPRMARHFHIPLQSGSDRVLAAMHRWYRTAHYARRIELIREMIPGAAIGADLIAGFPGETEENHAETMRLVEALPFTYLHVFSFSARPGTEGARLIEQKKAPEVPPHIIKHRSKELRALAAQKTAAFRASQAGTALRVLTLRTQGVDEHGPWTEALSDNYLQVRLPGRHPANQWTQATF